jgi:nucleotide-binding universal stress UspA family protein
MAVAAATFVVLGFGQSGRHAAAAPPSPPTDLYAAAMTKLNEGTSTITEQHGVVIAMMRYVSPADIPQISVDAAIAASRVQRTCGCRLRGYEVVTDRFGPDVIEVARGVPQHVVDPKGYTAQIWAMDGDSNAYIARRAAQLVKEVREAPGARVSVEITRGEQTVFSYALRSATGDSMVWALDGIRLPASLRGAEHPPPPGGTATASRAPVVGVLAG